MIKIQRAFHTLSATVLMTISGLPATAEVADPYENMEFYHCYEEGKENGEGNFYWALERLEDGTLRDNYNGTTSINDGDRAVFEYEVGSYAVFIIDGSNEGKLSGMSNGKTYNAQCTDIMIYLKDAVVDRSEASNKSE